MFRLPLATLLALVVLVFASAPEAQPDAFVRVEDGPVATGDHEAVLSGTNLRSGVYLVRLTAGSASVVTRATRLK